MSTNKNTFPPLISGTSLDPVGGKQLSGDKIIHSLRVEKTPIDPFFNPQIGLTGYAYNGVYYENGLMISGASPASWFTEAPGVFRGLVAPFPSNALVLLTDASISIMDITAEMTMWMVFLRGDTTAFCHNFDKYQSGFKPVSVSYSNGAILVNLSSDAGATTKGNAALILDFANDKVRLDMSKFDPQDVPSPDPVLGFLRDERMWIQNQILPGKQSFGRITRIPNVSTQSCISHGYWGVNGYTPINNPQPSIDESVYNSGFSGDVFGSVNYVDFLNLQDLRVDLYEVNNGVETLQGTSSVDPYGAWGPIHTQGLGRKLVRTHSISSGRTLGDSRSLSPWDARYHIEVHKFEGGHYTYSHDTPALTDGSWENLMETTLTPSTGEWCVRLIRTKDNLLISEAGNHYGLLRSWKRVPEDPSLVHVDPESLGLALLASNFETLNGKPTDFREAVVNGVLSTQRANGSWPALLGQDGDEIQGGYTDNSSCALMTYALIYTLNPTSLLYAETLNAITQGLSYLSTAVYNTQGVVDNRNGLVVVGKGQRTSTTTFSDAILDNASIKASIITFWAFVRAAKLFPGQGYEAKALALKSSLLRIWQGFTPFTVEVSKDRNVSGDDLEIMIWIALFMRAVGNYDNANTTLSATDMYSVTLSDSYSGYARHLTNKSTEGISSSVTMMTNLLTRRLGKETLWKTAVIQAMGFRGNDFGWGNEFLFGLDSVMERNESLKGTAWAVLAQDSRYADMFNEDIQPQP
jgi:hypothetical protein